MTAQRGRPYSGPAPMSPAANAGLRQRRAAKGQPTRYLTRLAAEGKRFHGQPLEWWEVIELQTCRDLDRMRREGAV